MCIIVITLTLPTGGVLGWKSKWRELIPMGWGGSHRYACTLKGNLPSFSCLHTRYYFCRCSERCTKFSTEYLHIARIIMYELVPRMHIRRTPVFSRIEGAAVQATYEGNDAWYGTLANVDDCKVHTFESIRNGIVSWDRRVNES